MRISVPLRQKSPKRDWGRKIQFVGDSEKDYITVQRLSSNVEGRHQKNARIGALAMVPLNCEPTIANIKLKLHVNASLKPMIWNVTFWPAKGAIVDRDESDLELEDS